MDGLGRVKVPAAIVVGADDPTVPDCKKQKLLCPRAEYFEIRRSGHMCIVDQAEEFNRTMWNFLENHSPS